MQFGFYGRQHEAPVQWINVLELCIVFMSDKKGLLLFILQLQINFSKTLIRLPLQQPKKIDFVWLLLLSFKRNVHCLIFLTLFSAWWARRNSAFCAIFWHFLVQNLRRIVLKIPVKWKNFWTIFLRFLSIYVLDFLVFGSELAQKMYKIGTEFLTCTRFCFQKAQKTIILSSVNSSLRETFHNLFIPIPGLTSSILSTNINCLSLIMLRINLHICNQCTLQLT